VIDLTGRSGRARTCDPRFWSSGGIISSDVVQSFSVAKSKTITALLVHPVYAVAGCTFAFGSDLGSRSVSGQTEWGLGIDGGTPETEAIGLVVTVAAFAAVMISGWWHRRRKPPE